MVYNKYISDIYNKDDILLSKNFLMYKKINYKMYNQYIDLKCLFEYSLSNSSNSKIFLMFLSFFYFFFNYNKFKIIKGNQNRILYLRLYLNKFSSIYLSSFFYYFNSTQDLKDFVKSRVNFKTNSIFLFFHFIYLKSFLNIYMDEDNYLDIVEDNYIFTLGNN
jgi:hypothetical protein